MNGRRQWKIRKTLQLKPISCSPPLQRWKPLLLHDSPTVVHDLASSSGELWNCTHDDLQNASDVSLFPPWPTNSPNKPARVGGYILMPFISIPDISCMSPDISCTKSPGGGLISFSRFS